MTALVLKYLFVILHIITAAGWFGVAMRLSGQARLTLTVDQSVVRELAEETSRTVRMMSVFIALTLVFSVIAFLLGGGFAAYGVPYHTSILLIVAFVLVQFFVISMGWKKLHAAVLAESRPPSNELRRLRKRIAAGVGVGHLLWLVLLVLMFWNVLMASF